MNVTEAAAVVAETREELGQIMVKVANRSSCILTKEQFECWRCFFIFFFFLPQALLDNKTNDELKSNTTLYLQDPTLTDGAVFK